MTACLPADRLVVQLSTAVTVATVDRAKSRVMALVEWLHTFEHFLYRFFFFFNGGQYLVNIENVSYVGQSDVHEKIDGRGSWNGDGMRSNGIGVLNTAPQTTHRNDVAVVGCCPFLSCTKVDDGWPLAAPRSKSFFPGLFAAKTRTSVYIRLT